MNPYLFGQKIAVAYKAAVHPDQAEINEKILRARTLGQNPGKYVGGVRVQTQIGARPALTPAQSAQVTAAQSQANRFNNLGASQGGAGRANMGAQPAITAQAPRPAPALAPPKPPAAPSVQTRRESPDLD